MFSRFSDTSRSIFTLVSGTTLAQAINLAAMVVLSRLYTPEEFGLYGVYYVVVNAVAVVACGKYETAIVLPKQDSDALHLLVAALLTNLAVCALWWLCFGVYYTLFAATHPLHPPLMVWYALSPPLLFLIGVYQTVQLWTTRFGRFRIMSIARFAYSIGNNAVAMVWGYWVGSVWGLFWGVFVGMMLYSSLLASSLVRYDRRLFSSLNRATLISVVKRYARMPRIAVPQAALDIAALSALSFVLPYYFDLKVVGFAARTMTVLQLPVSLIGAAMAQVVFKRSAEMYREGLPLRAFVVKTMRNAALIAAPMPVVLWLAGPWLFGTVFGEVWREAGIYAMLLSTWVYLDFIRVTVVQTAVVVERQNTLFRFSVVGTVLLYGLLLGGCVALHDPQKVLAIVSAGMSVYILVLLRWLYHISKISAAKPTNNDSD